MNNNFEERYSPEDYGLAKILERTKEDDEADNMYNSFNDSSENEAVTKYMDNLNSFLNANVPKSRVTVDSMSGEPSLFVEGDRGVFAVKLHTSTKKRKSPSQTQLELGSVISIRPISNAGEPIVVTEPASQTNLADNSKFLSALGQPSNIEDNGTDRKLDMNISFARSSDMKSIDSDKEDNTKTDTPLPGNMEQDNTSAKVLGYAESSDDSRTEDSPPNLGFKSRWKLLSKGGVLKQPSNSSILSPLDQKQDQAPLAASSLGGLNRSNSLSDKAKNLWAKLRHANQIRSTVKRVTTSNIVKNLNEKQIELISDYSHAKLDNSKIRQHLSIQQRSLRNFSKRGGVPKLKRILTKHAVKKADFQADFYTRVMKKLHLKKNRPSRIIEILHRCSTWFEDMKIAIKRFYYKLLARPFQPDGSFRIFWDTLMLIFILYDLITVPVEISFSVTFPTFLNAIDYIIATFFILDIFMTFNTGYYSKGIVIQIRKKIAMHYIRLWFWLDILVSFPYEFFGNRAEAEDDEDLFDYHSGSSMVKVIRIFKLIKIIRVLRVLKVNSFVRKIEGYFQFSPAVNGFISFFKLAFNILFLAHFIACFWHLIGFINRGPTNWLIQAGVYDTSADERYVISLYWAIATMITVGYGDVTAATRNERIYCIVVMIIGCGVFAYTMNQFGRIVAEIDGGMSQAKQRINALNRYMMKKNIDKETQARIRKYLEYVMETERRNRNHDESMLSMLSMHLRQELLIQINGKLLKENTLFSASFSSKFLNMLSTHLVERTYSPEELIFQEQDHQDCMYFIVTGKIDLFYARSRNINLKTLGRGEYFGEIEFFSEQPRCASAKSATFANVFILHKAEFLAGLERFGSDKEFYCMLRDNINLYNNLKDLHLKCFSCDQEAHITSQCPQLHHFSDRADVILSYNRKESNFRVKFTRKPEKRALFSSSKLVEAAQAVASKHPTLALLYGEDVNAEENANASLGEVGEAENEADYLYNKVRNLLGALPTSTNTNSQRGSRRQLHLTKYQSEESIYESRKKLMIHQSPGTQPERKTSFQGRSNKGRKLTMAAMSNLNRKQFIETNDLAVDMTRVQMIQKARQQKSMRQLLKPPSYNTYLQPIPNLTTAGSEYFENLSVMIEDDIAGVESHLVDNSLLDEKSPEEPIDHMEGDTVRNYEVYFPHNNITKIIDFFGSNKKLQRRKSLAFRDEQGGGIKEELGLTMGRFFNKKANMESLQPIVLENSLLKFFSSGRRESLSRRSALSVYNMTPRRDSRIPFGTEPQSHSAVAFGSFISNASAPTPFTKKLDNESVSREKPEVLTPVNENRLSKFSKIAQPQSDASPGVEESKFFNESQISVLSNLRKSNDKMSPLNIGNHLKSFDDS